MGTSSRFLGATVYFFSRKKNEGWGGKDDKKANTYGAILGLSYIKGTGYSLSAPSKPTGVDL